MIKLKNNNIDELLYTLPAIGIIMQRNYAYFKRHTAITNTIHIIFGLGLGMMIGDDKLFIWGVLAVVAGLVGHVYAFIKAGN